MVEFCNSWKRKNPQAEYRFYDDRACRAIVVSEFPSYLQTYDSFAYAVQRADFFRYLVVYRYGGLYADIDMECLKPFDWFFAQEGAVFCIEMQTTVQRQRELGYLHPFQIANCIFAAEPNNSFLGRVLERIVALSRSRADCAISEIEDITGPRMLTRTFFEGGQDVTVICQIFWMPPYEYPKVFPINKNMYACHHFLGSWKDGSKRSLRRAWIERGIFPTPFPKAMTHHLSDVQLASLAGV